MKTGIIERRLDRLEEKIDREFEYLERRAESRDSHRESMFKIRTDRILNAIERTQN